jgi:hypothetical protein
LELRLSVERSRSVSIAVANVEVVSVGLAGGTLDLFAALTICPKKRRLVT